MLVNQNLWSEFGAVEELSEQAAENISGGGIFGTPFKQAYSQEVFTITNKTDYNITHTLDGTAFTILPNESYVYTTHKYGTESFDTDSRAGYYQQKTYDLSDGAVYEFQNNNNTPGNPYDIDIYRVA
jgi:hypothetical protein